MGEIKILHLLLAGRPRLDSPCTILPTVADYLEVIETTDGETELREKQPDLKQPEPEAKVVDDNEEPLLEVRDLAVHFPVRASLWHRSAEVVKAVDGVSLSIYRGHTLGLVGESGCGKTTTGRAIIKLIEPTAGEIRFGRDYLQHLPPAAMLPFRKRMQIIFQDPYASLNPRLTLEQTLTEPMQVHGLGEGPNDRRDRAVALLEEVGLEAAFLRRYPHEFSGGQRQRLCVARALALEPEFIICDEAVSAMDVSVQAQVLNLLRELQQRRDLTYIFISHDLSVVKFMADTIAVMRAGKIVEQGDADEVYKNPTEKYTQALIEEKHKWVRTTLPRGQRAPRHRGIETANAKLQRFVVDQRSALQEERERTLQEVRQEQILGSREYAFCLFPEETLHPLLDEVADLAKSAAEHAPRTSGS